MKFNPAIADKSKWDDKTERAIKEDLKRNNGICLGYALCFFDPFAKSEDEVWSYSLRTAHDRSELDAEMVERLEASLQYIMAGVQKIFNVDIEELRSMFQDDEYTVRGRLH
jgi:hypothetical protein